MKSVFIQLFVIGLLFSGCGKTIDNTGTCSDGIKNQGEQGVDCGGPCNNFCPTCADGIMNQDEEAVDCGGQCDPCMPRFSASFSGYYWISTSRNAFLSGPGAIRIYGTNQSKNLTLYYSGPFVKGSTNVGNEFTGELRDENGNLYSSMNGGKITFTTFDTISRTVSGTFQFLATNQINNTSIPVLNGVFTSLEY